MVFPQILGNMSDSDAIEAALAALDADRVLVLPKRVADTAPERDWWLLDRAILLPDNCTLVIDDCTVQLSDACRDNFIRSANCGLGLGDPVPYQNIHIRGVGAARLLGADHPRSTGDSSKILACPCPHDTADLLRLADWVSPECKAAGAPDWWDYHSHSYGTDAGKEGESPCGDWRNIGILLANVSHFSIENLHIAFAHGWGISLEACSFGRVANIRFEAHMSRVIDGLKQNIENQDGVDLRNGCHHIVVEDITGNTGDDMVALTAIASHGTLKGGELGSTHVMHIDWSRREAGIHDVVIRRVTGASHLCFMVRLLPCDTVIENIVIEDITDTGSVRDYGSALMLGEHDAGYGRNLPDSMRNVTISRVVSNGDRAINVLGYLTDALITDVTHNNKKLPPVYVARENGLSRVRFVGVDGF
ncbi:MAG: hypothetical protein IJW89_01510 [Clostridia bacterium]|nr:hypothetical protein [Clostridia bacterium]